MPDFSSLGIRIPEVLLPAAGIDLGRWAVIACDQHTSEPEYWRRVADLVGDSPSTLHLILPEAFLGRRAADPVPALQRCMRDYLSSGVFAAPRPGFIYVERSTPRTRRRRGLLVALDLEHYDFRPGSSSLARASEQTVEARLPARIRARRGAALEVPHAIVLLDDPEQSVIEPLGERTGSPLYDAELMLGGGRVRGWAVDEAGVSGIQDALSQLALPQAQQRYEGDAGEPLLYAVGDGNHALAAARSLWGELRASLDSHEAATHPARYALVELANVHDPGVVFEPIHRVVFGVDPEALLDALPGWFAGQGSTCRIERPASRAELEERADELRRDPSLHSLGAVTTRGTGLVSVRRPKASLPVESLQDFLDAYTAARSGARVDYIHGEGALHELCRAEGRVGFLLPALPKDDFFAGLVRRGPLPPKTFSLGEADEKRFYLEARRIVTS